MFDPRSAYFVTTHSNSSVGMCLLLCTRQQGKGGGSARQLSVPLYHCQSKTAAIYPPTENKKCSLELIQNARWVQAI